MVIEAVGVVGAGAMGSGIAQVCLARGCDVTIVEQDAGRLEAGLARIRGGLARDLERERLTSEAHEHALAHLRGSTTLGDLADRDLVIEAIVELLEPKRALFADLGATCRPETVLASNTSSLSVSTLAGASGRADRVLGLHFFNPPTALRLVEVVTTAATSPATVDAALEFCARIDRVTVRTQDAPGFIVNRLLIPFIFDAIRMVEEGGATPSDVDEACRTGLGHTLGPLATADLVGLDVMADIGDALFEELGEARVKTPPLLRRMVALGRLGRKSGEGFFPYEGTPR
jgi:3-hydroxybutyryl-CoA dehydrogenase